MLAYGLSLQLVYSDGRILQLIVTTNPFAPFQQLWPSEHPALQIAAVGALVPAIAVLRAGIFGLRVPSSPLGDAAFQDIVVAPRQMVPQEWPNLSGAWPQILPDDDRHHLIIGPTRSGKGAGYVIPNALMMQDR